MKIKKLEMSKVRFCIQKYFPEARPFSLLPSKRKNILIYKLDSELGLILVCSRGTVTRKDHIGFFRMLVHKHLKKTVNLKKYLWINLVDMSNTKYKTDIKNLSQNGRIVKKICFLNNFYNVYLKESGSDFRIYFDSINFENIENPYDKLINIIGYFITNRAYDDKTIVPLFPRKEISIYKSRKRQGPQKKEEKEYAFLIEFLKSKNYIKKEQVEIKKDNFTYCNFDLLVNINKNSYLIELETKKEL